MQDENYTHKRERENERTGSYVFLACIYIKLHISASAYIFDISRRVVSIKVSFLSSKTSFLTHFHENELLKWDNLYAPVFCCDVGAKGFAWKSGDSGYTNNHSNLKQVVKTFVFRHACNRPHACECKKNVLGLTSWYLSACLNHYNNMLMRTGRGEKLSTERNVDAHTHSILCASCLCVHTLCYNLLSSALINLLLVHVIIYTVR